MKKIIGIGLLLITLMFATSVPAYAATRLLAGIDINTCMGNVSLTLTAGSVVNAWSFNPEQPGNWGGEFGNGAVTAFAGDSDDSGYVYLQWEEGKARRIVMRVLDGIADDSFNVYVKNPGGEWVLVYHFTADFSTTEICKEHTIVGFPAGKGQGNNIEIKIEPTNVGWSGFNTWGQLAVDYIEVYSN